MFKFISKFPLDLKTRLAEFMSKHRYNRALLLFIAILLAFLAIQDTVIILRQRKMLIDETRHHFDRELDLMAVVSREAMLKRDYDNIRRLVSQWAEVHEEYKELRAVAPDGVIIAEFKKAASDNLPGYTVAKSIKDNGRELMSIEMTGDFTEIERIVGFRRNRTITVSFIATALLGWTLWCAIRKRALAPLETEVMTRRLAEEQLEAIVEERTSALKKELAERKRVESELVDREEHIRLLLNSTAESIYGVDTHGVCTFCNPACLKMLGYDNQEELIGKNIHELIHHTCANGTKHPAELCRIYEVYKVGQGCHFDNEVFWRKDGSRIQIEYWSYPIIRGDSVVGAVVTFIDISERRKLEEQLLQSQKMEAIGTLAGGVAHDFNNILTAIVGYGSILQKKLPDESLRPNVNAILDASKRAAQLVRQLLAFGRKQMTVPKPVDINIAISNIKKLLERVIGADIMLRTELSEADLNVIADSSQIEQVLMNLATNARDAMPSGGNLSIRTERVVLSVEHVRVYNDGNPGAYALISVSDTGNGMEEKTREKIFEPFFTTKEVGKGTGLGLSIVYAIVKQHHGFMNVYSELYRGTIFKIYLPLVETKQPKEDHVEEAADYPRGTETVLVAEDDSAIRELTKSILEEAGYRVIVAYDGEDAIRKFTENPEFIHLALLDVIMPKVNGRNAYEEMRKFRPDIKVLFASGYAGDIFSVRGVLEEGFEFIQKPMLPSDLLKRVRKVLGDN